MSAASDDRIGKLTAAVERLAEAMERAEARAGRPPPHPRENWCTAPTVRGERCLKDAVADGLCVVHWRIMDRGAVEAAAEAADKAAGPSCAPSEAETDAAVGTVLGHPAENWCTAATRAGDRCLKDAVADGLCSTHWRLAQRMADPDDGDACR